MTKESKRLQKELEELIIDLRHFDKAYVNGTKYPYWLEEYGHFADDNWRNRFFKLSRKVQRLTKLSTIGNDGK